MDDLHFSSAELDELREAFHFFDKDGSGGITQHEMASVMGGFGQEVDPHVLDPLFARVDANGDDHLQFEEFVRLVDHLDPTRDDHVALHRSLVIFLEIRAHR